MRIYLACTVRGDRGALGVVRRIAAKLEAGGHEVLTSHLLEDDVDVAESSLSSQAVFERDLGWLDSCDLLVAEASGSSYGVGFEVGYILGRAATTGQRVLLLYDRARESAVSRMIAGNTHAACVLLPYENIEQIERALRLQVPDDASRGS